MRAGDQRLKNWDFSSPSLMELKVGEILNREETKPSSERTGRVHPFIIFFIRAILGVAIAILITRMFRGSASLEYVAGLAVVLVGLAYVFEYFRKRKSR